MDMVTLAQAKSYTNKAVKNGIADYDNEKNVVIDLDPYGFSIVPLAFSGGGEQDVYGTEELWEIINNSPNIVFVSSYGGVTFRMSPACTQSENSRVFVVSSQFATSFDGATMSSVVLRFLYDGSGKTNVMLKVVDLG